jgi:hypothetical protein
MHHTARALVVIALVAVGFSGTATAHTYDHWPRHHEWHKPKPKPKPKKKPKVTVVDGEKAKIISLLPCSPSSKGSEPSADAFVNGGCPRNDSYLIGSLSVVVKNDSDVDAKATFTFTRDDDGKTIHISNGDTGMATLTGADPADVPAGARTVLPLRFAVAPGDELNELTGAITVAVTVGGETTDTTFPVSAKVTGLGDIALQPSTLVIFKGGGDDGVGHVDIVGPGVRTLLHHRGQAELRVRLGGDNGRSVIAKVTHLQMSPNGDADRAEADITVTKADPGKYSGDLSLWELTPGSPKLSVELRDHWSRWVAFALLLMGTLFGGVLLRLAGLARRRALLQAVLDQSLAAYKAVAPKASDIVSWNLSDLLDVGGRAVGRRDLVRLQGAKALQTSIKTARTAADLDEDAARVLDMVARIQRWLRVEPAARRLEMVQARLPKDPSPAVAQFWRALMPWTDTQLLLEAMKSEPVNSDLADSLVTRLLWQARWQHRLLAVWNLWDERRMSLDDRRDKINKIYGETPSNALDRTAGQQAALDARLDVYVAELAEDPGPPPAPADPPRDELQVDWDADANSFTGWATLDHQSYGQLLRQSVLTSRPYSLRVLGAELRRIGLVDLLVALVAACIACAIYLPTVYNDTWGTLPDALTALLAGIGGPLVVKWAALPAFQSLRLRMATAAAPPTSS